MVCYTPVCLTVLLTIAVVRDGWEAKKESLETQMETLLGVKWTLTCNPLVIYPYAEKDSYGSNSLGDCIFASVLSFHPSTHHKYIPNTHPAISTLSSGP